MSYFQNSRRVIVLGIVMVMALGHFACKNETSDTQDDAEAGSPVVERKGALIPVEILNQSGESISLTRVFEKRTEGNGTVYQFRPGYGKIIFEPGIIYKFRADGYKDIEFEITEIQGVDSMTIFLNHEGNKADNLLIHGNVIKQDKSPFADVVVTVSEVKLAKTDSNGQFSIAETTPSEATSTPVSLAWKDDTGADLKVGMKFLGVLTDTVKVNFTVNTKPASTGADTE